MKSLIFAVILLLSFTLHAGDVYLCKSYSAKGGPQGVRDHWKAKTDKICIAYHHDKYYTDTATYKLSIAKRVEKYYFARFINKEVKVTKGTNWTVAYYKIQEPGDYVISIIDNHGYILGESYCVVK
ncbi:MAG: hypothetical protein JWN78_31 [Bacteroidota bacterium]|nr:hypothetical protein [Bacteroidota bacterium]